MKDTFRLGRIAGIRVGLNWSAAIMTLLVAYLVAVDYLPHEVQGYGERVYWLVGGAAGILFVASLLAHELAHAVVARRNGVQVEGITLWLLGGLTRLDAEPKTARADLATAVAGPITSLLVGGIFTAGAVADRAFGGPDLLGTPLLWLGFINIFLAVFNLLPVTPLDGGRVLRASVWAITGSRARGAATANRAGVIAGWAFVAVGALNMLVGALLGGLWLAMIGAFIIGAARTEQRQAAGNTAFEGLRVSDVMSSAPVTVPGWLTVAAVIDRYVATGLHSAYPVYDFDGTITGLLLLDRVARIPAEARATARVDRIAIPRAAIASGRPDEPLKALVERMAAHRAAGYALVFTAGALVGIVSRSDIRAAAVRGRLGLSVGREAERESGSKLPQ